MRVVSTQPYGSCPRDDARVVALMTAIASFGAGLVHVAAAGDHDQAVMVVGFELVALLQVGLGALLVIRRPGRVVLAGGLAMMVVSVGLWAVSRTVGLGFIPGEHVEPVGFRDAVCVLFELVAAVGLWELLAGARRPAAPAGFPGSPVPVLGALAIALGAPALVTGGHVHSAEHGALVHAGGSGGHGASGHAGGAAGHAHAGGAHAHARHGGGSHPAGHPAGGSSGHAAHGGGAALAAGGHAGHGTTELAAAHTHGALPAADHAAHTTGTPGTTHPADHTTAPGTTHDPGHTPPPGGTPTHPPGHPGTDPAPPPETAPEPEPEPTLTQLVADEVDKLVPGN